MTKNINNNFDFLKEADLSDEQVIVYMTLVESRELTAGIIARKVAIGRSLVYKILDQLASRGLIVKIDLPGKVTSFRAEHPRRILELVRQKKETIEKSYDLIEFELGKIVAQYNLTQNKPSIRFIEGLEGLSQVQREIIRIGKDFKLIRSFLDKREPQQHEIIRDYVKKQVTVGIRKKVIGPLPAGKETDLALLKQKDSERLIDRKVIDDFNIPTQIMIYGNKVGITDYKNNILTTIIESESVRESFDKIFDYLYSHGRDPYSSPR